jgi:signal transduction histidine kinase
MARTRFIPARSWVFPIVLMGLCSALGVLQYRWIDEASRAERDRLRAGLKAALIRFSTALNSDLTAAVASFLPEGGPPERAIQPEELRARFLEWRESSSHDDLFRRIGLVTFRASRPVLWLLDARTGAVEEAPWPPQWERIRERMEARVESMLDLPGRRGRPHAGGPPSADEALLFEVAAFGRGPLDTRRAAWLIFELDADSLRNVLLPEYLHRHLGDAFHDYQMEAVYRAEPSRVFYRNSAEPLRGAPDAGLAIVDLNYDELFRRLAPAGARGPAKPRMASADMGRLWLAVRHRAGSLDAVVARTRMRNLAVTGAILLLMVAALAALILSTRRAQRLADMQMEFVTGVSHELRTPLTVIRTAAYNLRGRLAHNPAMVEKYGALIQRESERLTEIVEQVLEFARSKSGRADIELQPVSVADAVREALSACQPLIDASGCRVETDIAEGLPAVLAEPRALAHSIQNLLSNAIKYGGGWTRISAARRGPVVEICVADRGPGIPAAELPHVFEPFFRGRRAIDDQVHGTGLGLALVKSAAESFGGEVEVRSTPGVLTEFLLRLRAAPQPASEPETVPSGEAGA